MAKEILVERVPRLRTRAGDTFLASPNNAVVLLGRDRNGGVDSGYGSDKGAGAVTIVVGRRGEDPNIREDSATVLVSSKSDPDDYSGVNVGPSQKGRSSFIAIADCVRVVSRTDVKIVVGRASLVMSPDGTIVIEGNISLGEGAFESMIKGNSFLTHYATHTHPVAPVGAALVAGVMTPPPSPQTFLSERLKTSS